LADKNIEPGVETSTERKQAQEALRESEATVKSFESQTAFVLRFGPDGNITFVKQWRGASFLAKFAKR